MIAIEDTRAARSHCHLTEVVHHESRVIAPGVTRRVTVIDTPVVPGCQSEGWKRIRVTEVIEVLESDGPEDVVESV